jgi:DNA-directed RNA polymerase subunit N (RpoN/RPB10)
MGLEKRLLLSPWMGFAVVPTQTLDFAADLFYRHLTHMPLELLQRVEGCLKDAQWMGKIAPNKDQALADWEGNQGALDLRGPSVPLELLRVPWLVSSALVTAIPVDFACNNPECSVLHGFWELGAVSHRRQVVCGGCGVARYCCRRCQQQHWKRHKPVCKALQIRPN